MRKKLIFLIVALLIMMSFSVCFATQISIGTPVGTTDVNNTNLDAPVKTILGAIKWAGYIIAAGMIIYIGIKYLMASASEKADLKGLAIKYIIGALLIVFGVNIAAFLFSLNGGSSASGGGSSSTSQSSRVNNQVSHSVK